MDAICIDQNNIVERNHQVGLMSQIYSKAQKVTVCIEDTITEKLGQDYSRLFKWLQALDSTQPDPKDISTLTSLRSLSYFKRTWIIQEVVLAKIAFLQINDQELLLSPAVLHRIRETPFTLSSGVLS